MTRLNPSKRAGTTFGLPPNLDTTDGLDEVSTRENHQVRAFQGGDRLPEQAAGKQAAEAEGVKQQLEGESLPFTPLETPPDYPQYKHPRKNWRLKQGATPQWYKARNGVRTKALSGAARVARYRPHKFN